VKHLLTIAGSDSSGGAGIQADLKTFSALGTYGMSVICAVTAQNTRGVKSFLPVDIGLIGEQIDAVFEDIRVDAVKIGMLGGADTVRLVARKLKEYKPPVVVLDPVMVAKSGHRLLAPEAEEVLATELLPLADLVTPNLLEAEALADFLVATVAEMERAAEAIRAAGAKAVLVKGGPLAAGSGPCGRSGGVPDLLGGVPDLLVDSAGTELFQGERLDARHTHGTGCSLSSALAALLARGLPLREAVRKAKAWVALGIREGLAVGGGVGPIHHFHEFYDPEGGRR